MAAATDPAWLEPITAEPPALGRRSVMSQQWTDLAYFHWRYPPGDVQELLPPGLTVDTFDGSAWVGLIPFVMRRVKPLHLGPLPWLSTFVEINVRTYVVDPQGRRAVWFFSLDVPRRPIVATARALFSLPYCSSTTTHEVAGRDRRYTMRRRWPSPKGAVADMAFTIGDPFEADEGSLEHFLSARWALTTRSHRGRLRYGRVHHEPWPLRHIERHQIHQDVIEAAGLPSPAGPVHAMYSPAVSVHVGWLETVEIPSAEASA